MAGAAGIATAGGAPPAAAPQTSRFDFATRTGFFDWAVIALACLLAAAAYFDAWSYVNTPNGRSLLEPWQDFALHIAWLLYAGFIAWVMFTNVRRGRPLTRSVPPGYGWCVVGVAVFPAMVVIDLWFQRALGAEYGLSALFSPPRVGEIAAGGLMVSGPLRAAWHRQDEVAGWLTVVAIALLLSTITFATQFAHPFRDPWAEGSGPPANVASWIPQDLGAAGLVLQGAVLTAVILLLIRRFRVRFGSFTLIMLINGALMTPLKAHWEMLPVAVGVGLGADILYWWLKPGPSRLVQLRVFAFLVPAIFAAFFFVAVELTTGTWWPLAAWSGAILMTGIGGMMVSYLAYVPGARKQAAEATVQPAAERPAHWPAITPGAVKEAFEALSDRKLLASSPLCRLPYLSREGGDPVAELDGLLRDAARELSSSRDVRDAQAGHALVEYYVKRSGTHEQIADQLHLSRPNYFRRQHRACELIAERLEKLISFTEPAET
jgi:hypothetical protein